MLNMGVAGGSSKGGAGFCSSTVGQQTLLSKTAGRFAGKSPHPMVAHACARTAVNAAVAAGMVAVAAGMVAVALGPKALGGRSKFIVSGQLWAIMEKHELGALDTLSP